MLFNTKSKNIPAWGLDIGDRSLKLVAISSQGPKKIMTNYNSVDLPEGVFDNGKIINKKIAIDHIHKLIETVHGPKTKSLFVHSCLPETQTFIKLISIPAMTEKEIPEAVKWASEHHIPLSIDNIFLDWQIVEHDHSKKEIKILIGAVPKDISINYTDLIKESGLIPLSLEIEATAIGRALIEKNYAQSKDEAIVIIDIGATRSSLIVYNHPSIQFTSSLPFAGVDITKKISQELSLSMEQAEKAKIICGLDKEKCAGALKKILDQQLDELVNKIKSAFNYFEKNFDNNLPIKRIILCGGGSHFSGIAEFLQTNLKIPTQIGDPRINCIINNKEFPKEELLAYTTAIGLALKTYEQ